jgi:hypothetical protein
MSVVWLAGGGMSWTGVPKLVKVIVSIALPLPLPLGAPVPAAGIGVW